MEFTSVDREGFIMEFGGAAAIGLIFIGIVFLILVPVTRYFRTHGKSRETQRTELFEDYDEQMKKYRKH